MSRTSKKQPARTVFNPNSLFEGSSILAIALICVFAAPNGSHAQVIDDFESYATNLEFQDVWGSFADIDITTENPSAGTQSMKREGFGVSPHSGLSVWRDFSPGIDLSGRTGLRFWAKREAASVPLVRFAVFARDGNDVPCAPQGVPLAGDDQWHEYELDFAQFCSSVDLSNIVRISLNATNSSDVTGDVLVNFDDISAPSAPLFSDGFESGTLEKWLPPTTTAEGRPKNAP